jgi:hypothetical protein
VRDVLRIPAFRKHRDGNDILQILTSSAPLTDVIDNLSKQLLFLKVSQAGFLGLWQVGRVDDRGKPCLVGLVGGGSLTNLRLFQNLGIDSQSLGWRIQFRPMRISFVEIVLNPRRRFGPVADR